MRPMRTRYLWGVALLATGAMGCGKLLEGLKKGKDAGAEAEPTTAASAAPSASVAAADTAEPTASAAPSAAADEPLVLPGSCVDVMKDAKKHYPNELEVIDVDLDGDGKKDKIVHAAFHAMNDPYLFYVMRGTCGHFVGEVQSSGPPAVSGKKSKGLKSFDGSTKNPCNTECGCFDSTDSYFFNGKTYVAGKSKQIATNDACDVGAKVVAKDAPKDAGATTTAAFKVKDKINVEWKGKDWPATVIQVVGTDKYKIHYDGFDSSWDEVVGPSRIHGKRG